MLEIRIHGRGGQGAVSTGQIMAIAAFHDKKESQSFPIFGVERSGAPVQAFVRISDKKINLRSQVYHPKIVLVLEPSLIEVVDVTQGLLKDGLVIINSDKPAKDFKLNCKVETIDATSIAMKVFGRPIVNTLMIGAFAKITNLLSKESLKKAMDEKFLYSKGKKISDLNKKAIEEIMGQK
ncbi:pyruvate ferredoxin oxidoreductase subunit gamma [Candidatus Woesearchaeota archaeon]|nr:pyruvate ferredoxin oxidoreductase subunit gamma [Candidatus Woesearchaeota archaeon]